MFAIVSFRFGNLAVPMILRHAVIEYCLRSIYIVKSEAFLLLE